MKSGPNFAVMGFNKNPFVFSKSMNMTTMTTFENYLMGLKLVLKENIEIG